MSHFKAPDDSLHFLDDDAFEYLLPPGSVKITDEEADAIRAEQVAEQPAPQEPADPVEKLRAFLAANPDVEAIL